MQGILKHLWHFYIYFFKFDFLIIIYSLKYSFFFKYKKVYNDIHRNVFLPFLSPVQAILTVSLPPTPIPQR